jgi:prepilin-type processing-associated H-X9-DG protein
VVDQLEKTFEMFRPGVDGTAVKLTLGGDADELRRLSGLLAPPIAAAREAAERAQRLNLFKQLALALVNYESVHGVWVERASYDPAGRPLLSWRVHLLPYLDQQALYAEFHLDEPWDSPHNRQLIERMPVCYTDPNPEVRRAIGAGRTTFVAPVAAETLFPLRAALPDGKPLRIRDVKDGTSKTIALVEVVPERAVVWTKPEDWDVQLSQPLQGVQRTDRSGFTAVFCDGHVRYLTNDIDPQQLAAVLTRAGGERVD